MPHMPPRPRTALTAATCASTPNLPFSDLTSTRALAIIPQAFHALFRTIEENCKHTEQPACSIRSAAQTRRARSRFPDCLSGKRRLLTDETQLPAIQTDGPVFVCHFPVAARPVRPVRRPQTNTDVGQRRPLQRRSIGQSTLRSRSSVPFIVAVEEPCHESRQLFHH